MQYLPVPPPPPPPSRPLFFHPTPPPLTFICPLYLPLLFPFSPPLIPIPDPPPAIRNVFSKYQPYPLPEPPALPPHESFGSFQADAYLPFLDWASSTFSAVQQGDSPSSMEELSKQSVRKLSAAAWRGLLGASRRAKKSGKDHPVLELLLMLEHSAPPSIALRVWPVEP